MRSTFMGLEIGRRGVITHQASLDITGHNVANANTPGYSRQVPVFRTTDPYAGLGMYNVTPGQFGTGVMISDIARMRDAFSDMQIRDESPSFGYWTQMETVLNTIEVIMNEPTDEGLRGVIDGLWEAWQTLVESPESDAVRAVVRERGVAVADTFNHMYLQLSNLRQDLNIQIKAKVEEVNSTAQQIADLNQQIRTLNVSGQSPNDLNDRLDLLLDNLSGLIDAQINFEADGTVTVLLGGAPLVMGSRPVNMGVIPDTQGMYRVVWDLEPESHPGTVVIPPPMTSSHMEINLKSGELMGLLEARGVAEGSSLGSKTNMIPGVMDALNELARAIVLEVNEIHRQGFSLNNTGDSADGFNFFSEDGLDVTDLTLEWAKYITMDAMIVADVQNIAAALNPTRDNITGEPINFGDGGNALRLAQIKHSLSAALGSVTIDDYWRSKVSSVGVMAGESTRMADNQAVLLNSLEARRQSVSGVSLDEEMTNMIRFQHAYNAAARYLTAIDEAIDMIVNRMGIVGR
ncbi:MAG: flagellar hook-associated protein FlgK [Syntrophomonadaceae bacterium]|nr:flagellar hook-associated protein FlgK [Syntrophomonadaceae bacterium]